MSYLLDQEKTWIQCDFGLDKRLVKALSKLGYTYPTVVQSKCIPIALQGKDVLVRARTGAGKTVAFALPLLHKLLLSKDTSSTPAVRALILVPTKELCKQIEKNMNDVMYYCKDVISMCSLNDDNAALQQFKLQNKPDIVISTPARLVQHIKSNHINLSNVETLVLDEADLILSFGYADDIQCITSKMPKIFQGILMSATLSPELDKFKKVLLHNAAIIKLEENVETGQLLQFYLSLPEKDKFLVLYVFLKLGLLQQFFISAAVLNAELPLNSRIHILEEFNRGVFDYLIATDASLDAGNEDESEAEEEMEENSKKRSKSSKSSNKKSKTDDGYGVSRGIDFQGVAFVVNFDFPLSSAAYTHRIGRTARGNNTGTALTFVTAANHTSSPAEQDLAHEEQQLLEEVRDAQPRLELHDNGNILAAVGTMMDDAEEAQKQPTPLMFNMNELNNFRYRVEDTLRSVTASKIKEFRAAELKKEILNSQKLKNFFASNPQDLKVLRHDKSMAHPIRVHEHLKHVPDYLVPTSMRAVAANRNAKKKKRRQVGQTQENRRQASKARDPLSQAAAGEQEEEVEAPVERVFSNNESLGGSTSGRQKWKAKHKKGKFDPKREKQNAGYVQGSFAQRKKYK